MIVKRKRSSLSLCTEPDSTSPRAIFDADGGRAEPHRRDAVMESVIGHEDEELLSTYPVWCVGIRSVVNGEGAGLPSR